MTKTTPFHSAHLRLHARMVDFHGWEMPLHYGSQVEEHHAVRRDCGMFDISHMCALDAIGPDAKPFMQRLLANDVEKLRAAKALYSCMLNETGGVIDDLIAYYLGGGRYRVEGLKFSMGGRWELRFDISAAPGPETVTVVLDM